MPGFVHPLASGATFRVLYLGDDLKFMAKFREEVSGSVSRLVACSDYGSAALFLKSDIQYHLVMIDHDWRGNEGLKLARLARSQRHRKQMPILVVSTAKLDQETEALIQKARVVECVLKTAGMSELVSRYCK